MSVLPDPATSPELFEGVLPRRLAAFGIDVLLMAVMLTVVAIAAFIAGFFTFGLAWLAGIIVIPLVIAFYYSVTLGSSRRATVGMQVMDIVLTPTRGAPLNGPLVLVHALVFWVTIWISWPVSLGFVLFSPRQQMIHDLIVGTLMVRRSPMVRHWRSYRPAPNGA